MLDTSFSASVSLTKSGSPLSSRRISRQEFHSLSCRAKMQVIFEHRYTEIFICIVILLNFLVLVLEADSTVENATPPGWIRAANYCFSALFTAETTLKVWAFGRELLTDPWLVTDAVVVVLDDAALIVNLINEDALPAPSMMRIIRLLRLSKSNRLLKAVPEFHIQVECLLGAWKPIGWGLLLMFFTMCLFGVVGVTIIHPINQEVTALGIYEGCQRCPHAYESVFMAILTLSQTLILGDSWGSVSLPIIEHSPLTAIYFSSVFVILCFALTNVILAAVVDSSNAARAANSTWLAEQKEQTIREAYIQFRAIVREIDADESGQISKTELRRGMRDNPRLHAITASMDITSDDIDIVWSMMDHDRSGSVDYEEFTDQLYKLRYADTHTLLVFIKFYVADLRHELAEQARVLHGEVLTTIRESVTLDRKNIQLGQEALVELQKSSTMQLHNTGSLESIVNLEKKALDQLQKSHTTQLLSQGSLNNIVKLEKQTLLELQKQNILQKGEDKAVAPRNQSMQTWAGKGAYLAAGASSGAENQLRTDIVPECIISPEAMDPQALVERLCEQQRQLIENIVFGYITTPSDSDADDWNKFCLREHHDAWKVPRPCCDSQVMP